MSLFESREPVRPFPCPACGEYMASGAPRCRHCGAEVGRDYADDAARRELFRNRLYRKKHYAKNLRRGGALFVLGLCVTVGSYFFFPAVFDTDFVWIPRGLVVGGGMDFLYGVWGLGSEARGERREGLS